MKAPQEQQRPVVPAPPTPTLRPERLAAEFEDLGLGPAEARVIVSLLRLGAAIGSDLAKAARVPRTGVYPIIRGLQERGLVERVPAGGPAMWTTPGYDRVLDRLHAAAVAAQEQKLQDHILKATLLREVLAESVPAPEPVNLPFVHVITCPARLREDYERLLAEANEEVLVFNRPPFATDPGNARAMTMDALARGVSVRVMYQAAQAEDPEATGFRASADEFKAAGLEARVVDVLPLKLFIVDRRVALLALDNPHANPDAQGVTLLIEHPGYAAHEAELFEAYWAAGRSYGGHTAPKNG